VPDHGDELEVDIKAGLVSRIWLVQKCNFTADSSPLYSSLSGKLALLVLVFLPLEKLIAKISLLVRQQRIVIRVDLHKAQVRLNDNIKASSTNKAVGIWEA
jgi:hypothetical protein